MTFKKTLLRVQLVVNIYLVLCILIRLLIPLHDSSVFLSIFSMPLMVILFPLFSLLESVSLNVLWLVFAITYIFFVGIITLGTYVLYKIFHRKKHSKS